MRRVELTIAGNPYSKARPRVTSRGTYTPAAQKANADALAWDIRIACQHRPFTGNVAVDLTFYRRNRQRIDLDNLIKQVLDAANGVAWLDDSQVTAITAKLHYDPADPRTDLVITDDESTMERGTKAFHVEASCERCGSRFTYRPYPSQRAPRYCSQSCTLEATCEECGRWFRKQDRRQRFCSRPCAARSRATRTKISNAAKARARPPNYCRRCNARLARGPSVLCRDCWFAIPSHSRRTSRAVILAAVESGDPAALEAIYAVAPPPSSRFPGVSWRSDTRRWTAYVGVPGGRRRSLGCFDDEEEAGRVAAEARGGTDLPTTKEPVQ